MKKKYGNKGSRSSRKSQRRARRKERQETERTIQLSLPLVELLASAQESLGRLVVDVGMSAVGCLLEDEVTQHAGERYGRQPERQAFRWGRAIGCLVLSSPKVRLSRKDRFNTRTSWLTIAIRECSDGREYSRMSVPSRRMVPGSQS